MVVSRLVILSLTFFSLTVLFQNCGFRSSYEAKDFSQSSNQTASLPGIPDVVPPEVLDGKTLYTQNCSSCHGPVATSAKLNRNATTITQAIASIPLMNALSGLSSKDIDSIAAALAVATPPPVPPQVKGTTFYTCTPGQTQKTPLLHLTNREFRAALSMLLDDFSTSLKSDTQLNQLISALPTDSVTQDRNTLKEQSLLISQPIFNARFDVAFRAGALVSGAAQGLTNYPNTNQCLGATAVTQACHSNFVSELSRRAFRRPLSSADSSALATSLWNASLSKTELLQSTLTAIVLMPEFEFKAFDQGSVSSMGANTLIHTSHELAAKMAFFITGAPPDAQLRALADSGTILQNSVLSQQVDRLLGTDGAREMVRRLFRESLGYDVYDAFAYGAGYLNGISTTGLRESMNAELDDYFVRVALTNSGTWEDVMTSTSSNVSNASLASIYGVSTGTTNLPSERAGFLNRAAMLTKRSGYAASPIKRGLKVLEHVLCDDVGLPPPSAPTSLPTPSGNPMTTRQRTVAATEASGTSCTACHGKMNNLGYPFERFDSLGRYRLQESIYNTSGQVTAQLNVDTRSTTSELVSSSTTVENSADLARELGGSDRAMMCFVRNLKRFESRVAYDPLSNCQLNASLNVLYKRNGSVGSIREAIRAMVLADEFRRWSY